MHCGQQLCSDLSVETATVWETAWVHFERQISISLPESPGKVYLLIYLYVYWIWWNCCGKKGLNEAQSSFMLVFNTQLQLIRYYIISSPDDEISSPVHFQGSLIIFSLTAVEWLLISFLWVREQFRQGPEFGLSSDSILISFYILQVK